MQPTKATTVACHYRQQLLTADNLKIAFLAENRPDIESDLFVTIGLTTEAHRKATKRNLQRSAPAQETKQC